MPQPSIHSSIVYEFKTKALTKPKAPVTLFHRYQPLSPEAGTLNLPDVIGSDNNEWTAVSVIQLVVLNLINKYVMYK